MKKSKIKNQTIAIVDSTMYQKEVSYYLMLLVLVLTGALVFTSCSSKQKTLQQSANATTVITYKKERSRGNKLPLYTIEVLDNKTVRYTGTANVPFIGERIIELNRAEYKAILEQFQSSDFKSFESTYKGNKRDLPLTSITFEGHKITYQEVACPTALQALASAVEEVVEK